MSRVQRLGLGALGALLTVSVLACSSGGSEGTSSDRPPATFAPASPTAAALGLCRAYDIGEMKDLMGGGTFRRLAPESIGSEGDPVTGETCSWQRAETNGDALTVRVEVRDYGTDTASLASQFDQLQQGTLEAQPVDSVGDAAFSSVSDETSLLQVRSGQYLLTVATRSGGGLEPLPVDTLKVLAAKGLGKLP